MHDDLLRVALVNARDHDDTFVRYVERDQHQIEFDWNDQTEMIISRV